MNYSDGRWEKSMAVDELVQTRIDPAIKQRAASVLAQAALTVSEAVRILLTRTANEGVLPLTPSPADPEYDPWFRTKVREAMDDPRPPVSHEDVEIHFAACRSAALAVAEAAGE
jgi:DNA-damage-inducible protein J